MKRRQSSQFGIRQDRLHPDTTVSGLLTALDSLRAGDHAQMIRGLATALESSPSLAARPEIKQAFTVGARFAEDPASEEAFTFFRMMSATDPSGAGAKTLRETLGLTMAAVAQLTGYSQANVSRWEAGKIPVPPEALSTIVRSAADPSRAPAPKPKTPSNVTGGDLRRLRQALQMTQAQFANLCGVDRAVVSQWETGVLSIPGKRYIQICEIARSRGLDFPLAA
jgi:transcriptional regulator with XRE-family HTH domain